jgi:LysM repeat protein
MTSKVRFDEADARTSTSVTTDGSVIKAIRQAVTQSGIDPLAELYNEALELAHEGHYGDAQSRLHVLLGLAPNDGDAHLLLAKIFVAGQLWRRALTAIDQAAACGAHVSEPLRTRVVTHLHADDRDSESERQARAAREQGEIRKLRSEARALRSDNAHLVTCNRALERETTRWAWISTSTSLVAIAFLAAQVFFTSGTPAPTTLAEVPTSDQLPVVDQGVTPPPTLGDSPRNGSLATLAGEALMTAGVLEGAELEVVVRTTTAQLSGTVRTHAQMLKAVNVVSAVNGIEKVGNGGVIILARRDGTTHVVQSGDTLGQIAFNYYGKSGLHKVIIEANPSLGGKANLRVGQTLVMPAVRDES